MNEWSIPYDKAHTVHAQPIRNVTFHNDQGQVGEFDFSTTPATFTGDVDESARIFVDAVIRMWGERA